LALGDSTFSTAVVSDGGESLSMADEEDSHSALLVDDAAFLVDDAAAATTRDAF